MGQSNRIDTITRLLGDECVQTILKETTQEPMSAAELTEACTASQVHVIARILHYADVENAYDTPERVGRLAGAITLRDDATVITGGGDNTIPGVLSLVCDGEQAQDFYKAVKPAVDVYGIHDFDNGFDAARRAARGFPGTWLNANAILNGDRFAAAATTPTTIVKAGDTHIGFVGVTTESLTEIIIHAVRRLRAPKGCKTPNSFRGHNVFARRTLGPHAFCSVVFLVLDQ